MLGRISKLEKDIFYLENFIDNYEFISGKDDLYNYSFVENFDNADGSSESELSKPEYVDRDGSVPYTTYMSGGFIDTVNSKFKIGSSLEKINTVGLIKSHNIKTNYNEYISSSSDILKTFDDRQSKVWSVSIKSPRILTGLPIDIEKYVTYDYSYMLGAKTIVELSFRKTTSMDTISISPNMSDGLKLMQIALEQSEINTQSSSASSSSFSIKTILKQPVDMSNDVVISFDKCKVKKVILVFNQDTYTRTENTAEKSELVSKYMHEIVLALRAAKKRDHNILQDLVLSYFRKNISIDENKRNQYLNNEYYTYKYPVSSAIKHGSSHEKLNRANGNFEAAFVNSSV